MGSYLLGVRTDTYDLDTRLRAALAAHVVDGTPANNNYSVRLDDPPDGAITPLRTLYRGRSLEVASRSRRRVVDALLAQLSVWSRRERPDLLEVDAVAAVGARGAVLLPASLACHSPGLERRLARAGWSLLDAPAVHLDARTGELAVEAPDLDIDWEPLASLRDDPRPTTEGPGIAPGRHRVVGWAFSAVRQGDAPPTPAAAVLRALGMTWRPPGLAPQQVVDLLAGILTSASALAVGGADHDIAAAVLSASGQ